MSDLDIVVTRIYRDHFSHLVSFLIKEKCDSDDANDLAQEVFELYMEKRKNGNNIENPCSWLMITGSNRLRNLRKNNWYRLVSMEENMSEVAEMMEIRKLCMESEELCRELIMKELTELQRNVFVLVGLNGYSYKHVGSTFYISDDQASLLYKTACRRLRHALYNRGINNLKELL